MSSIGFCTTHGAYPVGTVWTGCPQCVTIFAVAASREGQGE